MERYSSNLSILPKSSNIATTPSYPFRVVNDYHFIYPKAIARSPLPIEVPEPFAGDYLEACLVLTDSAKASAALSRRCLQRILREVAGSKPQDLSREIDEVLPKLPGDLAGAVD